MTKAAICTACSDIVGPYRAWQTDRRWRWCQGRHMGVRWIDGDRGIIEVTAAAGPQGVRVLGLNNMFLEAAVGGRETPPQDAQGWRDLHRACATQVGSNYLFHITRRACWAVVARVGESSDIVYVEWLDASANDPK